MTLLLGLAHPDDELGTVGTVLAQKARGDRVVIIWLTAGEQTEAFGRIPTAEVARRRREQGMQVAEMLGAEGIFMDLRDTAVTYERETLIRLARLISEIKPDGLLTWGDAWVRGMRHPDHQECGRLFRDAITMARMGKIIAPHEPHRRPVPVFTIRDAHSSIPPAGVDVTPFRDRIAEVAALYRQGLGFGDPDWLERRLREAGQRWGVTYAEEFDAWEANPETLASLIPAAPFEGVAHPDRPENHGRPGGQGS